MSKSSHMGEERICLQRISVLEQHKKQLEREIFCIMDHLFNTNPEFIDKRSEITEIISEIEELKIKVEHYIDAQTKR